MNCTSIPLKFKNTSFTAFYIIINLNDILIIWTNLKLVYLCVAKRQNTCNYRKVGRVPQKFVSQNSVRNNTFLMWVLISTVLPPNSCLLGLIFII